MKHIIGKEPRDTNKAKYAVIGQKMIIIYDKK